jgi:hypothetical protein|tara:strand:+ start:4381 stop:4635 length:255 start_codon:yes stop_codon:yes gene_type:complete
MDVVTAIKDFGFPIVAALGMLYVIYFVWKTITQQVEVKLDDAHVVIIGLIDRVRMLDNDIIRLQQKLDTAIEMRRKQKEDERQD